MKSEMSDFITLSKHLSISMLFPPRNLNSKPISKSRKNTDEYMKFNKKNSEIDSELFGVKSIKNNNCIKEKRSGSLFMPNLDEKKKRKKRKMSIKQLIDSAK